MRSEACLTTTAVRTIFTEEITAAGGKVSDVFDDGARLFARSVLPGLREVKPGDRLQGGVAVRVVDACVWVHPYVFREVCSNGAIMAQSLPSRQIDDLNDLDPEEAEAMLREAVRACCAEDAFATFTADARSATDVQADLVLHLMPMLSKLPAQMAARLLSDIVGRFVEDRDSSMYGLMNAATAVARDTQDPEARWQLEELGAAILAAHPDGSEFEPGAEFRAGRALQVSA